MEPLTSKDDRHTTKWDAMRAATQGVFPVSEIETSKVAGMALCDLFYRLSTGISSIQCTWNQSLALCDAACLFDVHTLLMKNDPTPSD